MLTLCLIGHVCLTFMSDRSVLLTLLSCRSYLLTLFSDRLCISFWLWLGHLHILVNVFWVVFILCVNVLCWLLLVRSSSLFWSMYLRLSSYFCQCICWVVFVSSENVKGCEKSVKFVSVVMSPVKQCIVSVCSLWTLAALW